MALRTFQSNPALGGFGGESVRLEGDSPFERDSSGDAFAQILKELVDNSVDSCRSSNFAHTSSSSENNSTTKKIKRRVRIRIQRCHDFDAVSSSSQEQRSHTGPQHGDNSNAATTITSGEDDETTNQEILRIEVVDNGCGMKDIQACVDPFFTSKAHNSAMSNDTSTRNSQQRGEATTQNNHEDTHSNSTKNDQQTAGRYGIGLTLCLLHAQRLVPSTRTSITSATVDTPFWTEVTCVVDTENDSIQCVSKAQIPKQPGLEDQSGTSVSLLLPGGQFAAAAWTRVLEYLKRFQLSLGLPCSIEVLAPTLSRVPVYIKQIEIDKENTDTTSANDELEEPQTTENGPPRVSLSPQSARQLEEESFFDLMPDPFASPTRQENTTDAETSSVGSASDETQASVPAKKFKDYENLRKLQLMAQQYLSKSVAIENVARALIPIRSKKQSAGITSDSLQSCERPLGNEQAGVEIVRAVQQINDTSNSLPDSEIPKLEVSLIVYGTSSGEAGKDGDMVLDVITADNGMKEELTDEGASVTLVRMVNSVPLLDSAQAVACGLVQGLNKRSLWQPFGLNAQLVPVEENRSQTKCPKFYAKDSDQVAPFFHNYTNHKHGRFRRQHTAQENDSDEDATYFSDGEDEEPVQLGSQHQQCKRGRRRGRSVNRSQDPSKWLCPAKERIGNILVIVQVIANPKTLPLPTLCKGRLPLEDKSISTALEVGFARCVRFLQKTNPTLFLTTQQLRRLERDVVLIPSMANALVSITSRAQRVHPIVQNLEERLAQLRGSITSSDDRDSLLATVVEENFRKVIKAVQESKSLKRKKARISQSTESDKDDENSDGYHEVAGFEGESLSYSSKVEDNFQSQQSEMNENDRTFDENDESFFEEL